MVTIKQVLKLYHTGKHRNTLPIPTAHCMQWHDVV